MRTIASSDWHLPFSNSTVWALLERAQDASELVLCGDTYDLVKVPMEQIIGGGESKQIHDRLRKLAEDIPVIIIPGNHDGELQRYSRELAPMHIFPQHRSQGFKFTHGHEFDLMCRSLPWKVLQFILPKIVRWETPAAIKKVGKPEKYHRLCGLIHGFALAHLADKKYLKGLVMGHTHFPLKVEMEDGRVLLDCGDRVDSRTCVIIEDEVVSLERS